MQDDDRFLTNNIVQELLNERDKALVQWRADKVFYLDDSHTKLRDELNRLYNGGASYRQLSAILGTKDHRTLKDYMTYVSATTYSPQPTALAPTPEPQLSDYLIIDAGERLITAVEVPLGAWNNKFAPVDGKPYNGFAKFNEKGVITTRSEHKSPLLGEQLHGPTGLSNPLSRASLAALLTT